MKQHRTDRRAFSLIEVVVAIAIGAVVIGGGMLMYYQGNKYFYTTTEHTSFRAEALLLTERIAEDLAQLQVSTGKRPDGKYWLVKPFDLSGSPSQIQLVNEAGTVTETVAAGSAIRFPRFHHVEMRQEPGADFQSPTMVARMMQYETKPVDPGDPSKGVNLFRNGEKINTIPLQEVVFHKEPAIVAANQVQGSPNAIVSAYVIPRGGTFGNMDYDTIQRLAKEGSIVKRTYHLVGYESFYTSVLYSGMQSQNGGQTFENLDALTQAVVQDANQNAPGNLVAGIEERVGEGGGAPTFALPEKSFAIEATLHDDEANFDEGWLSRPTAPGKASGEGIWECDLGDDCTFEDNGQGPGSGSGGSGSANASGSGSG